jgi:aldose sugar dehydrogenase
MQEQRMIEQPSAKAIRAAKTIATRTGCAVLIALLLAVAPATAAEFTVEKVATGLVNPWGLQFLPDGRMLVTERAGRLRIVDRDGKLSDPITGVPEVYVQQQGGLLDVALDPKFADNRLIYVSFSEPRGGPTNATAVARGKLVLSPSGGSFEDVSVIFRQQPAAASGAHFGSRLVFARDGTLFVTLGDRFVLSAKAQDLSTHIGKIVRINADGSIPADNPFAERTDARQEIWSYGHRNVQGAALEPVSGKLWTVEHGARGGDEVNHPEGGKNYGWPIITFGRDYSGARIGIGTKKEGMEQPVYYWDPSIAPSGMTFYDGSLFPEWRGNLFVGALAGQALHRLTIKDGGVVADEALLTDLGERIRDVRQGPDGALYVLTDADPGQILKLRPK